MKVGIIMKNSMVEKIMELNRKIESITMKTTSYFSFGEKQNLNNYDRQIIEYYQEILNLIIEIAKREEIKNVEIIDLNKDFSKAERIITAQEGRYNFSRKVWVLKDANIYSGNRDKQVKSVDYFTDNKYNDIPDHFITTTVEPRTLTIKELKQTVRDMTSVGGDTRELLVELGNRYSFPFASFIISFLGLALGGRYVRGTSAVSLGVCVLLGYGYYIVKASFEAFTSNGFLNPLVGGWIPNILFFVVGIYLLNKAEY